MNSSADPHAKSYAQLPYDSSPFFDSHPGRLATIAYLSGLDPVPVASSRVLELGCAAGGNLIPAAEALPGATFLGIDMAPNQIAAGAEIVQTLGLANIRMEAMSLTELTPAAGQFDYIIAHGLYSWVPDDVRRKTMEVIKALLSPRGIAYVSYNVLPGWYLRAPIRDMLFYGSEDQGTEADGAARLAAARAYAEMVLNAAGEDTGDYSRLLKNEVGLVLKAPDGYIAHDHMEQFHAAVYFRDFAAHAAANGLMYLGDARFSKGVFLTRSRVREQHPELFVDTVRFEQTVDYAFGRQFRRSLLCHGGQTVNRDMDAARLMRCHLTAAAFPTGPIDLRAGAAVSFQSADGGASTLNDSLTKAALGLLAQAHPLALSFDDLWEKVRAMLQLTRYDVARETLAASLLSMFVSDSVEVNLMPSAFVTNLSQRPVATSLARLQASRGQVVHNRRHRTVRSFNDFDRSVLRLLDGTRDLNDLRAAFASVDERILQESLGRLAAASVLIA